MYLASASYSLAQGNGGHPVVAPPGWAEPAAGLYGPVYFYATAGAIRTFGLSTAAARMVCVTGAVLMAVSAAGLIVVTGAPVGWAAMLFLLLALSPEVGTIASNGRMDSLAIGLELAGMTCVMATLHRRQSRFATLYGPAAGVLWSLAVLTTPRTLPFFGGLVLALPLLFADRATWRPALRSMFGILPVVAASVTAWAAALDLTPFGWLRWLWDTVRDDAYNIALPGHARFWALGVVNSITPGVILLTGAAAGGAFLLSPSFRAAAARAPRCVWYFTAASALNAAFYIVVANYAFGISQYFVLPLLAAMLCLTSHAAGQPRLERALAVVWIVVALAFAGVRVVKDVQIWQTWALRDPVPLERFLRQWVPAGSVVYGYDEYYFFAVERAGSTFQTLNGAPKPAPRHVKGIPRPPQVEPRAERFVLWPTALDGLPTSRLLSCAQAHPVAAFERPVEQGGVEKLVPFAFTLNAHGYPPTALYQLTDDCLVSD